VNARRISDAAKANGGKTVPAVPSNDAGSTTSIIGGADWADAGSARHRLGIQQHTISANRQAC
jgi:hypothetical protein